MTDQGELLICRCEEISAEMVQEAMASGASTPREIKMRTRLGMGACQGRVCRGLIEHLLGDPQAGDGLSIRPPVRLVPASDVLAASTGRARGEGA